MDKKLFIFIIGIFLISSIFLTTSITFRTGTYIEMYPAFRGTVCILQDNSCISGTEKTIDFALAKVWGDSESKLVEEENLKRDQEEFRRLGEPIPPGRPEISMIEFDGIRYRGNGFSPSTSTNRTVPTQDERTEVIQIAKNISVLVVNLTNSNPDGSYAGTDEPKLTMPFGFGSDLLNILNLDGSEINDKMFVVIAGNASKIRELSIKLTNEDKVYTLVSIEKQVTEPITYTFEG